MKAGNLDFRAVMQEMVNNKTLPPLPKPMHIKIDDSVVLMHEGLGAALGEGYQWLPEYGSVAAWLDDNQEKGLALIGKCGRGKTIIACHIIPVLLKHYYGKVVTQYDATALASEPDKVMRWSIVCVDDIGTEGEKNEYGNRRNGFAELVDRAEKEGKLLIITSNLTNEELTQKYGERTMDRLRGMCKCVIFKGESLRGAGEAKPRTIGTAKQRMG